MTAMTLFYTAASPYARKVRIVAQEKNLAGSIDEVLVNLAESPAQLLAANPIGKIPALVRDDGFALYDSPVICDYLDATGSGARLIPATGDARWRVLRAEALADGALDAAVAGIMESRRPAQEQSPAAVARQKEKIGRSLVEMENQLALLPAAFNLGHIAFISALGYLDFRFPEINWRDKAPTLAQWFEAADERQSARLTRPQ